MQTTDITCKVLTFSTTIWLYHGKVDEDGERPVLHSWGVEATSRYGFRLVYTGFVADEAHAIRLAELFAMQADEGRWDDTGWVERQPVYGSSLFQVTDPTCHWLDDDEDREARRTGQLAGGWPF